jgi:SAM-dependent methyltransferase
MEHRLYHQFANRYDLHTPSSQYKHNHEFVIKECLVLGSHPRLLDVGCGTGVLIQKASEAGIDAFGIDPSPAMIEVCRAKFAGDRVRQLDVEHLADEQKFNCVTSLSWSLNYCNSVAQFFNVLQRIHGVLLPGGIIIMEVPNAAAARGTVVEERKPGPTGLPDDVIFLFCLEPREGESRQIAAHYVYACKSLNELLCEEHILNLADPFLVADLTCRAGFEKVSVYDSFRKNPLAGSVSPFVVGCKSP